MKTLEIPLTHKLGEPNINNMILSKESFLEAFQNKADPHGFPIVLEKDNEFKSFNFSTSVENIIGYAKEVKNDDITIICDFKDDFEASPDTHVLCTNCIADSENDTSKDNLKYKVLLIKSFSLYTKDGYKDKK